MFWALAWPVVLVLNLFWGPDRRWQAATVAGYVLVLLLLSLPLALSVDVGPLDLGSLTLPPLLQPLFIWLITAAPSIFLLLFLNRRIRSIGPLLLVMMVVAVVGTHLAFLAVHAPAVQRSAGGPGTRARGRGRGPVLRPPPARLRLFLVPGWLTADWLRRRYQAKRISDQTMTFDAIWLLMALIACSRLATEQGALGWLGLLAFAAYRLVVSFGMRPLARGAGAQPNARLLLLRVFGAQRRSERLFDLLGARWRYRGSIQLIGGTDLATTTLEPHEFLDFLSGRLARNFIRGRADLERRVADLDLRPDPDGRFRVNDLFCDGGAWQMAVARLMAQSDVVLMDLRGFSAAQSGLRLRAPGADRRRAAGPADPADRWHDRVPGAAPDAARALAEHERGVAERARAPATSRRRGGRQRGAGRREAARALRPSHRGRLARGADPGRRRRPRAARGDRIGSPARATPGSSP